MWGKGMKGKGYAYGGMMMGGGGYGGGYGAPAKAEEEDWAPSKKKKSGGGASPGWEVEGFNEALQEAFAAAGVADLESDVEDVVKKIHATCHKQCKKFYNDERVSQKATNAQARSVIQEFVEAVMGSISQGFYDKPWFEKVGWDGALLMLTFHTMGHGKMFSRTLKTEIAEFIQTGIIQWYEEEKLTKATWDALEAGGLAEGSKKKASQNLAKAFDEAHFQSPFGETENENSDVAELQDFVKGWMSLWLAKSYQAFENGLPDSSKEGQVAALTAIFQHLCDPNVAALPLKLQNVIQPAPWPYIEQAANEVIAEMHGDESSAKKARLG